MSNKIQFNIFDEDEWSANFRETLNSHKIINNYLSSPSPSKRVINSPDRDGAKKRQLKNMIVVFCTYIEVMVKDFVYSIYIECPEKIENQLPKEFRSNFTELLSRNALRKKDIEIFATIAAKKSFDYEISTTLNRICNLVHKEKSPENKECTDGIKKIKGKLIEVFKVRNSIVHENKESSKISEEYIEDLYSIIATEFIQNLDYFCSILQLKPVMKIKKYHEDALKII